MRYWLLILALLATPVQAQITDAEEIRARDIGHELRCVVCQNQSIEESDAMLAQDMRRIVRDRVAAGDSNADVIAYMRERYGDYVLLKPPVQGNTYVLWFLPFALMGAGLGWFVLRRRRPATPEMAEVLSEEDRAILDRLMEDGS